MDEVPKNKRRRNKEGDKKHSVPLKGTHLAKMLQIERNRPNYRFCTPWHSDYEVHRRYQNHQGFDALREFYNLRKRPIDPSVSDSRLDHLKTLEGSFDRLTRFAAMWRNAQRAYPSLNGCTGANHLALEAIIKNGDKVVIATGCHRSIEDWVFMKSCQGFEIPLVYIATEWSVASETYLPPTVDEVESTLSEHPDTSLVLITCPTYPGLYPLDFEEMVRTIRRLTPVAKILVDAAWGSYFGVSSLTPDFPLDAGVDLVTTSDHKTALAEEQGAMLYLAADDGELMERLEVAFRTMTTTSPSHLLFASLDASIQTMMTHGERLVEDAYSLSVELRSNIEAIEGLRIMGEVDFCSKPSLFTLDPLKLFVDVSATGFSGRQVYHFLEQQERIVPEMATEQGILFLVNPAYAPRKARDISERLWGVLNVNEPKECTRPPAVPPAPTMLVPPAQAIESVEGLFPLEEAVGRVAARPVGVYPPGIYVLRPGQLVDFQTIRYIQLVLEHNQATVQGLTNGKILLSSAIKSAVEKEAKILTNELKQSCAHELKY